MVVELVEKFGVMVFVVQVGVRFVVVLMGVGVFLDVVFVFVNFGFKGVQIDWVLDVLCGMEDVLEDFELFFCEVMKYVR